MMIKKDLITPEMVLKAMVYQTSNDPLINHGHYLDCQKIAKRLNEQLSNMCLYCGSDDPQCQCWNDE